MSAMAIVRFWTLAMLAYVFLEEERDRLQRQWHRHVTIGEARREIQRRHRRHVLDWLHGQFQSGVEPDDLYELLSACEELTKKCKHKGKSDKQLPTAQMRLDLQNPPDAQRGDGKKA